jgi:endonuclease/exonuclease/phosphatase family metal-dependent hydrolase
MANEYIGRHRTEPQRSSTDQGGRQRGARLTVRTRPLARRLLLVAFIATVPALLGARTAQAADRGDEAQPSLRVMTRNMDEGTDFGYIVGPKAQSPFALGAALTYAEVLQSGLPQRAAAVADEIANAHPDLVSLQEVARWQGPTLPPGGGTVTLDALQSLQSRLSADGAHYRVVVVVPEEAIAASLGPGLSVTFLDRDVILARSDRSDAMLHLARVRSGHFSTQLTVTIPGQGAVTVTRGWASVDATTGDHTVRFIATHLESFALPVQAAQAAELVSGPAHTRLPVILAGDLNTGPNAIPGPAGLAMRATYDTLTLHDGFVDSWSVTHPGVPGYTDSLYTEDPFTLATLSERIDLVLVRGDLLPVRDRLVGTARVNGLFPSDHLGVVSSIRFPSEDD